MNGQPEEFSSRRTWLATLATLIVVGTAIALANLSSEPMTGVAL
jgi:hypothetical protein